jgi:hypothetical protein
MNDLIINNLEIKDMIYEIRGRQVLLDRDLAQLYGVETKRLLEQVKRNIERFPERYMFQMNEIEFKNWKSHFATSNSDKMGLRRPPYCFIEQGSYMVSNIIKNKKAVETSTKIMDAFVAMKRYLDKNNVSTRIILIENKLYEHDLLLEELFDSFKIKNLKLEKIIFDGQEYDAYSLLLNIISCATNEIIIFDNYLNNKILDMIDKNINVILVRNSNIKDEVVDKYMKQYNNLKVILNNNIHDRYIIIDRKYIYYVGASLKDIGKKCFSICLLDSSNIELIINRYINNVL